jgi:thioredoxin 1
MSLWNVNESGFDEMVLKSDIPVLVDFWASWCGPCRMIAPILEKLQQDYEGKIKIVKVDIDANPSFSERFKIQSIPNLVFFKGGVEIDRIIGAASVAAFKEKIDKVIA